MIVRTENEGGMFAVIFRAEQEARSLYERMAKDASGKVALIELLDEELNTMKFKFTYSNTYTSDKEASL